MRDSQGLLVWALGETCLSPFLLLYRGGKGFLLGSGVLSSASRAVVPTSGTPGA